MATITSALLYHMHANAAEILINREKMLGIPSPCQYAFTAGLAGGFVLSGARHFLNKGGVGLPGEALLTTQPLPVINTPVNLYTFMAGPLGASFCGQPGGLDDLRNQNLMAVAWSAGGAMAGEYLFQRVNYF